MEACEISEVIRTARLKSGMTQESLAFGICSVSTLSKIENGRRMPHMEIFEALMDRMGEPSERCLVYAGEHELEKKKLQEHITTAILLRDKVLLEKELERYHQLVPKKKQMDEQWVYLAETVLKWWGGAMQKETEQRLTEILRMSCQDYDGTWSSEVLYTHCEVLIFLVLVLCRMTYGDYSWGSLVLHGMRNYLERGGNTVWKERMLIATYALLAEMDLLLRQYPSSAGHCARGLILSINIDYYRFAPLLLRRLAFCEAELGDTSESHRAEDCSKLLDELMTSQNYLSKFIDECKYT